MKELPRHPNLENLRKRAKRLLHDYKLGRSGAIFAVKQFFASEGLSLRQAQLVVARQYSFNSWAELAIFVSCRQGGGQMANRINHFMIPVLDLDRAAAFYKKVLACEVWIQREDGYAIFEWEKGDVTGGLALSAITEDVGNAGADGVRVHLNCEGRLDDAIAQARDNGGHLLYICSLGDYGMQAIVRDTEGNCVHLHTYSKKGAEVAARNVSPPAKAKVK